MSGPNIGAGMPGVSSSRFWETTSFFRCRQQILGQAANRRFPLKRRALRIEPLECRHLMDAAGLASLISPDWFATVAQDAGMEHANVATWTAENTVDKPSVDGLSDASSSNLYDWIVQFDTSAVASIASVAETASLLAGGNINFQVISGLGLVGMVLVRSSDATWQQVEDYLAQNSFVDAFELDAVRQFEVATSSNDPYAGNLWGMNKIDAKDAWGISTGSQSVVVAVIDTGVDYTHSDLAANIWRNSGEIAGNGVDDDGNGMVDDLYGYDFLNNDGDPMDDNGHGTHVSGTIAAVGNNGIGVVGLNWTTSIMALKFLGSNGQGYISDAIRAVNYATMERTVYGVNIRVMNNSWGGGGFSSAMQSAIQAANDAGILFVAAAGNSGSNNDLSPQYPANYAPANVISVAATNQYDQLAYFSCYGATTVDVAAPGMSIYSTLPGNRYGSYSGTSMATPHVAALAALAWAVDPTATVAEVRSAILNGAESVAALSGKVVTGGRINAFNTLQRMGQGDTPAPDPTPIDTPAYSNIGLYDAASSTFYLNSTNGVENINSVFQYSPAAGDWTAVTGDWNGNGQDTIGLYDAAKSRFYLRNSNDTGKASTAFSYGPAGCGWTPITGDWDGDGVDTIGLYNPATSTFYLKNSNAAGVADVTFVYGPAGKGWIPVVGDWNGDGRDTIGLYNPGTATFYLRDSNSCGFANSTFVYGPYSNEWKPVSGDWNGDGRDTIGLYNAATSTFYLRNNNTGGHADVTFAFGAANNGATPIVGAWFAAGTSSVSSVQDILEPTAAVDAVYLDRTFDRIANLIDEHLSSDSALLDHAGMEDGGLLTALDHSVRHGWSRAADPMTPSVTQRFGDRWTFDRQDGIDVEHASTESGSFDPVALDRVFELLGQMEF